MEEYFSKLQTGDKDAFEYIYTELKNPVYTIAYRIVQSKELAEDVTQDVFLKLFAIPQNLAVKYPRAWIFQMTHNAAIDAAVAEANQLGIHGKETTPFLLAKIKDITGGDSLASNIQLVYNNARLAALTAKELCQLG